MMCINQIVFKKHTIQQAIYGMEYETLKLNKEQIESMLKNGNLPKTARKSSKVASTFIASQNYT